MKKVCTLFALLTACLICALLPGSPSLAYEGNESVCASIPSFPVTVNGVQYNNRYSEYPFLVYNDMTYLPLTYDLAAFTGLMITFAPGVNDLYHMGEMILYVGYDHITAENLEQHIKETANTDTCEAVIPDYHTYISFDYLSYDEKSLAVTIPTSSSAVLREYDNESPYPILNVEGVTYLPLTWDIAHRLLDWEYSFSEESGLVIDTTRAVRPFDMNRRLFGRGDSVQYILGEHFYLMYDTYLYYSGDFLWATEDGAVEYSLQDQLRGKMHYFNAMFENDVLKMANIPPTINDGILTMMCAVNVSKPLYNVMITVDLDNGIVLQVEKIE